MLLLMNARANCGWIGLKAKLRLHCNCVVAILALSMSQQRSSAFSDGPFHFLMTK